MATSTNSPADAVDDAAGALTRGFSFTRRRFSKQLKRLNVGRASRRTKQMRRLWTKVHRGNRLGTADGDVLTNHLGLCLQLAFTAQRRGASGDDGGGGEAAEEAVKREVYAVKKMEMANGETAAEFLVRRGGAEGVRGVEVVVGNGCALVQECVRDSGV